MTKATTGTTRGLIALALMLLTVLSVVGAGVLVHRSSHLTDEPFSLSNSGQPVVGDAERHQVLAIAEQFCLRMDALDASDLSGYKKRVSQLLTTKQKARFDTEFDQFQKLSLDPKLKGTGTILTSGLSDIDEDSATALVAHDSSVTDSTGTNPRHYRWTVALRKVHGHWLVDDFTPVS